MSKLFQKVVVNSKIWKHVPAYGDVLVYQSGWGASIKTVQFPILIPKGLSEMIHVQIEHSGC